MCLTCTSGHAQGLEAISRDSKADDLCNGLPIFTIVDLLKNSILSCVVLWQFAIAMFSHGCQTGNCE